VRRTRALIGASVLVAAACGSSSTAPGLPDIDALKCPPQHATAAVTSSLGALAPLAAKERTPITGRIVHAGHGRAGADPPLDITGADRTVLARELRAAADVACRLRTTEDARRAGYVVSANFTEGVGTHWTNWRLVDAPFDPTRPSMLLYGPRLGETRLVGFSYWVRSDAPGGPIGFAGDADHWHRHFGLCFDTRGLLQRENATARADCAGRWLNGSDIWMLHAWVVPGDANVWGVFAALNPVLCRRNVPDILRCPGFD
jgi:hypothetical protein